MNENDGINAGGGSEAEEAKTIRLPQPDEAAASGLKQQDEMKTIVLRQPAAGTEKPFTETVPDRAAEDTGNPFPAAESEKAAKPAESEKAAEPAESGKAVKPAESGKAVKPAESEKAVKAAESGKAARLAESGEAAKRTESENASSRADQGKDTADAVGTGIAANAESVENAQSAARQGSPAMVPNPSQDAARPPQGNTLYPVNAGPGENGGNGGNYGNDGNSGNSGNSGNYGNDGNKGKSGNNENSGARKNGRIAFLVSMFLIIAILGGIYAYGYKYCGTHFMPGTQINGYDCSGKTEEEAEAVFAEAAKEYVLNVRFRGGNTEIVHAQDIGFEYKPDGSIAALLQQQDCLVWPKYFFEDSLYEIKPGGTYDDEKLTAALQMLPELQEENMEKPRDAYIEFQDGNEKEDGKFVIIPETAGTTIDLVQLEAGVGDAAARYSDLVDAEEIGGAYVEASMKADNAKIIARCADLNDLVGASITYELPSGDTMRLNADVTKDWLVKDDSGKLVKDEEVWDEKLWEFLDQLAYNTNTIGSERQFKSTLRGTITVSGGDYGYMVNQITEHDKLVKDFAEKTKETRKPDYYITPYNDEKENDGIGTTYIEVDLSAQHIWCYVGGELKMESDCVSGDVTTDHGTPTGVFGIMFMLRDTTLRGVMQSNGKYEYETKVGYWMPFYNGCGFHDAWWRSAFGGTIYQGNGSHGCVNLPVDAAAALYSYCEDKMPVVVYW